jgi:hypothetical protein
MRSRVFLSCGQRPGERDVARDVGKMLEKRGFDAYIAIDVQTILEINTRIIRELKNSDCFLFLNFRRDEIGAKYRGSLFSNQELAIAYALGFERILVINQHEVLQEGMLQYIGINTETFSGFSDCCSVVERALDRSGWAPDYSRRLRAGGVRFSVVRYGDLAGHFLYVDILNDRPDIAALEATGTLRVWTGWRGPATIPYTQPIEGDGTPRFLSHDIPEVPRGIRSALRWKVQ